MSRGSCAKNLYEHRWRWHVYDNDGSYNGCFNWVPRNLRVGPWSPFAGIFLALWCICMWYYMPHENLMVAVPESWSAWWWWDTCIAFWGILVLTYCKLHYGISPILTSYTMWSWTLLTVNAFCSSGGALLTNTSCGDMMVIMSEITRFPAIVGATVTWFLWNCLLFPLIYTFAFDTEEARQGFWKFNFGLLLTNVHLLNLPIIITTLCIGGNAGGARHLGVIDLWWGLLVSFIYALMYLLVLDRAGVHYYPIFSPRTHFCALSYSSLLLVYVGCWRVSNMLIDYLN